MLRMAESSPGSTVGSEQPCEESTQANVWRETQPSP